MAENRWIGMVPFLLLPLVRISSVFLAIIDDCDEVYNYWEPLHYLVFRYGFQTWEYSPKYAIRSYSFLVPMAWIIKLLRKLVTGKVALFYLSKCFLASCCALSEFVFYMTLKDKLNQRTAMYTLVLSVCSTGFINAGPAYLPNSLCMCLGMLCCACWIRGNRSLFVFLMAIGCLSAWPYFAIIAIPFLFESLMSYGLFIRLVLDVIYSVFLVLVRISRGKYETYGFNRSFLDSYCFS